MLKGVTAAEPLSTTYARLLRAEITIALGALPTAIGWAALLVAVTIGVTVLPPLFVT